MTDDQQPDPADLFANQEATTEAAEEEIADLLAPTTLDKLRRLESSGALSSKPHHGMTFGPTMGPVNYRPPVPPPVHRHRWAWAQLVSGGERRVCYDCGAEA